VVTAVDGHKISSAGELQSAIDAKKPGDTVTLTITRNGSTHTIRVKLGTRPT
jgi:S1-C subfamily serine protease